MHACGTIRVLSEAALFKNGKKILDALLLEYGATVFTFVGCPEHQFLYCQHYYLFLVPVVGIELALHEDL